LLAVCADAVATSKMVARAVRCRLMFMLDSGV
jgi:galactitol-specific phosphotransferase system IIB component